MADVLPPVSVYSEGTIGNTPVSSWLTASSGIRTEADIASTLQSIAAIWESMANSRQQGPMTSVATGLRTPGTSDYSGFTRYPDASWQGSTQDLSFESNATNAEPAAVAPLTQLLIRKLRHVNPYDLLEWSQSYAEKESKHPSDSNGGPLGAQGHKVWIQRQLHSEAFWDHLIKRSESSLGRATSALRRKRTSPREETTVAKIGADLHAAAWTRMRALDIDEDQQTVVSTDSTSQGFKDLVSSTGSDAPPTSNGLPAPEYSAGDAFLPDPTSDPALVNANGDDLHPDALDADMGDGGGDSAGAD